MRKWLKGMRPSEEQQAEEKWLKVMRSPAFLRPLGDKLEIKGATGVFVHPSEDQAQDKLIGDFRNYLRRILGKTSSILEIGAGYNPMFAKRDGYNVATLDHDDQAGLTKKWAALDTSRIEAVDFVWRDGRFADLIGQRKFDAVAASHVVEHAPDFVQFLNDSSFALKDGGTIFLLVPDKRFCFDYFQPVSDPAKVLADHREKRTRHSFASFYRRTMHTTGNGGIAWDQRDLTEAKLTHADPHEALRNAERNSVAPDYMDMHENYFTPASFAILVEELGYLGKIDVRLDLVTRARGCEFLVALKKITEPQPVPASVFMQRKKAWCGVMLAEECERIRYAHWPV
jgi:2-polyprenyl-3-methyl-5-hydroxy-6-metoxy-1,4-benzoquinol methylase